MRHNLDLKTLQAFVTFAQTQNVTRTARTLNVSQSPLSRRLRAFEDQLGLALFERHGRGLKLTKAGRALVEDAAQILTTCGTFTSKAQALARGDTGQLRVGCVPGALHIPMISGTFAGLAGHRTSLTISQMGSAAQFDALISDRIDLGISYRPARSLDLQSREVFREAFVLAEPEAANYGHQPVPFVAPAFPSDGWLVKACHTVGITAEVRHHTDDPIAALNLVAANLCCAIVQSSLANTPRVGVRFRALPSDFPIRVTLFAVHKSDASNEVIRVFKRD